MTPVSVLCNIPFDISVLASLYPGTKHINEKAQRLEESGLIVRLKKGMYVAHPSETGVPLNRNLIANHLYGPSYVSLQTALRYYGLTPERVNLVQSITTKHKRKFETPVGDYDYENSSQEYFPIGVRTIKEDGVSFLMATPEKALCDLINYSKGVNLRFVKDVILFLEEDIRFDTDIVKDLNLSVIEDCALHSRKSQSIRTLIKYLRNE